MLANGPLATRLGISGGSDCLGGSTPANARLARARSSAAEVAQQQSQGAGDLATMGQPAKLGLCFAENEAASPWPPLHVERGFAGAESTVTLFGISGSVEVVAAGSGGADEVLQTLARSMTIAGTIGGSRLIGGGEPLVQLLLLLGFAPFGLTPFRVLFFLLLALAVGLLLPGALLLFLERNVGKRSPRPGFNHRPMTETELTHAFGDNVDQELLIWDH